MCGLVGIASTEGFKERDTRAGLMEEMLVLSAFRGWESTGVAVVEKGKEKETPVIYKRALNGADFIHTQFFGNQVAKRMDDYSFVIGHNRSATRGQVTNRNAHPFQHGNITLVHNGTIENIHQITPFRGLPDDLVVDSDKLAWLMATEGDEKTLIRAEGAYALVWHDAKTGTLNFCRNDRKPLYWAYIKGQNTMLWASEPTLILHVCERRKIELDTDEGSTPNWFPKPHHIITFEPKDLRSWTHRSFTPSRFGAQDRRSGTTMRDIMGRRALQNSTRSVGETEPPWSESVRTLAGDRRSIEHTIREALKKDRRRNIGRPTKTRKIEIAERELREFGYRMDDRCLVIPTHWTAYKNQQGLRGIMTGQTKVGAPFCMYNVLNYDFRKYFELGEIMCVAVNVVKMEGKKTIVVLPHPEYEAQNRGLLPGTDEVEEAKYRGPKGKYITLSAFRELASSGCGVCSSPIAARDHEAIIWLGENDSPLCVDCQGNPKMLEELGIRIIDDRMH